MCSSECQHCLKDLFTPWPPFLSRKQGLWSPIQDSQKAGSQGKAPADRAAAVSMPRAQRASSSHVLWAQCWTRVTHWAFMTCLAPMGASVRTFRGFCYSCCKWHQVAETWGFRTILIPLQLDTPRWPSGQSTELFCVILHRKRGCLSLSVVMATMGTDRQQDLKYKQQFRTKFNNSTYGMSRCWSVPSVPAQKGN